MTRRWIRGRVATGAGAPDNPPGHAVPLDRQAAAVLDLIRRAGQPEYCEMSPRAARARHERQGGALDLPRRPIHSVRDHAVPGRGGKLRVRVYRPRPGRGRLPALLWLHGGGHVVGSLDGYDAICRCLALDAGCVVASVEYRLAPEHRFPAAVEDTVTARAWLHDQAAVLGVDPARIAIGGDSAGGNLAAVGALLARTDRARHAPCFQLLVYPATAPGPDSASCHRFATDHLLSRRMILWFQQQYLRDERDRADPRFAPLLADSLHGVAPAFVIVGGCDPLRDEGVAYAERLAAAGVPTRVRCFPGQIHAFVSLAGAIADGRRAISEAGSALAGAFRSAPGVMDGRTPSPLPGE